MSPQSSSDNSDQVVVMPPSLKLEKTHPHANDVKIQPTKQHTSETRGLKHEDDPLKSVEIVTKDAIGRSESDHAAEASDDFRPASEKPRAVGEAAEGLSLTEEVVAVGGRERMKRHRVDVAGRVWIPDLWGQEELLKDWIDCSGFEASLMNSNLMLARAALVEEGRRANSGGLRIQRTC